MKSKDWFHAQIRWAVLQEGKRGLLYWKESAYLFQSEDHETAFQQALQMGRRHELLTRKGRCRITTKLAEIVSLDRLGPSPTDSEGGFLWIATCSGKGPGKKTPYPRILSDVQSYPSEDPGRIGCVIFCSGCGLIPPDFVEDILYR